MLSPIAPNAPAAASIASSANESEDHDRFSTSAICHALLHPITLEDTAVGLDFSASMCLFVSFAMTLAGFWGISCKPLNSFGDRLPNSSKEAGMVADFQEFPFIFP